MKRSPIVSAIQDELDKRSIKVDFQDGSKHPKAVFMINGKRKSLVFSGTSSDRRAILNILSTLRRMIRDES